MFKSLSRFISSDLAIDLGTANTLVYAKGRGIVVNEPSVVAVTRDARGHPQVLAVGRQAKEMLGKTPGSIEAIRPLKDGVIADFEITGVMLKYFIHKALPRKTLLRPRIIVCIPYGITEVEKRAVRESTMGAGAREVFLIEEPMAAAIGAGLPVHEPSGNMVIDIGGGTTDIAVISLGGIVYSRSVRVGGDKSTDAILNYIKKKYNLLLGEQRAEQVKLELGNAYPGDELKTMEIKGRDLIAGVPKIIEINSDEVREALQDPINTIVNETKITLERTPPELAADIVDKGIIMTGGGSLLHNLDVLLREETGLPVMLSEDPLTAVVNGSGIALEQIDTFKGSTVT